MNSLQDIQSVLMSALGSDALFGLVNTRIILRTGVDLRGFSEAESLDSGKVGKVLEALKALGYSTSALQTLAKANATRAGVKS